MKQRDHTDVSAYYNQQLTGIEEATGAGLIWFMGRDHLSPPLSNEDNFALNSANWRQASSERVIGLADKMKIKLGELALDLGCGIGGPGRDVCAATGAEIVGLSNSSDQLKNLLRISREVESPYTRVVEADMQELPFEDSTFDHVYSINAIYHVDSPGAVIGESHRVLKPDGCFGVDDWFVTGDATNAEIDALRYRWSTSANGFHDFASFVSKVKDTEFSVEEIVDFTDEAGDFLTEERFGLTYDEQIAPVLLNVFPLLYKYDEYQDDHRHQAVSQLRESILYMGELYRNGSAVYRQLIATK